MKKLLNWRLLAAAGIMLAMVFALVIKVNTARAGSGNANPGSNGYSISNNTPGFIKKATDTGAKDPTSVITATVWLKLHNTAQLDQLAVGQSQKGNANYHKWIDQASFNATYAPTAQEANSVGNFLKAHDLTILTTSDDNGYVKVQGTVGAMEKAFHTQIDTYTLNGQTYYANNADPNINDASGAHVDAVSLDNYGFTPNNVIATEPDGTQFKSIPLSSGSKGTFFAGQCFTGTETHTFTNTGVTATYTGNRFGTDINNTTIGQLPPCGYAPNEMQAAYNMNSLYSAGFDGTGQTVVITDAFGDPTIQQDAEAFSQVYGLPDLNSSNFQVLRAPGAVNNPVDNGHIGPGAGWAGEITLDVEWVHAMAPKAHIDLVVGPTNGSDLDEAVNYAVVHHLGNTISNSWSSVEGFGNPAHYNRDNRILEEAAVQGIDVNFSSGDNGDELANTGLKTVDFPGSSPFATSIGGTSLALNADNSMAWQSGWGTNLTKIAGHANAGSPALSTPLNEGFVFGAGGGTSLTFAKPAWQSSLPGTMRQVPDVSMLADPYTGVEIIETDAATGQLGVGVIGGTSLASPMFSAIMAIASEKAGHGLGQAAPLMYGLQGTSAITDVTSTTSATNVTGTINSTAYSADQLAAPTTNPFFSAFYNSPFSTNWFVITFGTDSSLSTSNGWDNVTGVGTPNGANFVNALGN